MILTNQLKNMECSLAFIFDTFLPIIKACQKKSSEVTVEAQRGFYIYCVRKSWEVIVTSFLTATDLVTVLPNYKKTLIRTISNMDDRESGLVIAKGLASLIRYARMCLEEEEMNSVVESEEEDTQKKGKDTQWDEIDGVHFKPMHRNEWPGLILDRNAAKAVIVLLKSMAESLLEVLQKLYESFHGDYHNGVPKFSGVGKKGDVNTVAFLRDILQEVYTVASPESITRLYAQITQRLDSVLKEEESIKRTRQQILLVGILSAIIPFLNNSGKFEGSS